MADVSVDLKPDRSLLDPNFDGYKLSLEALPTYRVPLSKDVDLVKLTDDQYSFQHVKAFGIHNHLVHDPWNQDTVYFVDNTWSVYSFTVDLESSLDSPVKVFQIPDSGNQRLSPGRHNVTFAFPSPTRATFADGAGKLYILDTGDRKGGQQWKVSFSETVLGEGKPFTLLYSTSQSDNETHRIDCLLLHVDPSDSGPATSSSSGPSFVTVLEWLTYVSAVDRISWSLERTRRLTGSRSPDYATLQHDGQAVIVSADRPFKMVYDSLKPVEADRPPPSPEAKAPPAYTWRQSAEEVSAQFSLPADVGKADIAFRLTTDHVELGVKNGHSLLEGDLHQAVDVEGSAWTIEGGMLELTLEKKEPTTWPLVVCGDTRGEMVMDPNEVKLIHERLAHLTTENPDADPEEAKKPAYNAQELEECDMYPDDTSTMLRVDGETHSPTHQVHLGSNQWLFTVRTSADRPPAVCFRHDVDGLVWQPDPDPQPRLSPCTHTATFNALGYVQASKTNKKFTGCAPDYSYAFIADCTRHIYVYRQPSPTVSPLRNRKTGREVAAISKQQVISLETAEDIFGIVATAERLYILAGKILHIIRVKFEV